MNDFLKSKQLYMLFVLPFIVMAIAFTGSYFSFVPAESFQVKGCIDIAFVHRLDKFWSSVIGGITVLGIAYMIFFINEQFKLLQQTTTLPSLIYVLLTSGVMISLGFDYLLISVFILTIAIGRLQLAINDIKGNHTLFDFGALVVLAVAIYPKFVLLVVWAMCVVFFSGRSTLKDISALLLGLITPVAFLVFYYFWTDRLAQLPERFVDNLMAGEYIQHLPVIEFIRLGILLFLLMVALINFSVHYAILVVGYRRGILAFISMLFFLSVTLFVIPVNYYDFMYIFALPLAFVYSLFFLSHRVAFFGNLLFLLFLGACFLAYWCLG